MTEILVKKRGRPKKQLLEKKESPSKNIQENWTDDFVFPIFSETKKNINQKQSPYILDLKHQQEKKEVKNLPAAPVFNPDNWFSNFPVASDNRASDLENLGYHHYHKNNFDSPAEPSHYEQKITYHRPDKYRYKNNLKLNLSQGLMANAPQASGILLFFKKFFVFRIMGFILYYFWQIIAFPFRMLDFLVDRTLKAIWHLIKGIFLGIINLFILTLVNFKKLFMLGLPARHSEVNFSLSRPSKRIFKPLVTFFLAALIIIIPFQIINLKQKSTLIKGQVLGQSLAGFEALKEASLKSNDFDFSGAAAAFEQAYFNFSLAESYLNNLDGFSQEVLRFLPAGKNGENLIIIGQLSAKIGADITELGKDIDNQESGAGLLNKVIAMQNALNKIEPNFLELKNRVQDIDQEFVAQYLDETAEKRIILFQSALPALADNFEKIKGLTDFLANFLGLNETKNYLFIFENNNEIRPTGGFMGSFALAEIKNGEIACLEVPGGGFYDLKAGNQILVEAPKPFQLFAPTWQIWNANWFPDWPASAEKIAWFYEKSVNGITVDGVITLTPNVLEDLLKITGPIKMPTYNKIISSENLVRELQEVVELEYDKTENQPKKIISDLMPMILAKIFNLKTNEAMPFLALINKNVAEKNILLWFRDEAMEQVAQNFSAAGQIKNNDKDFLMVVHTNIGGGKTDRVIKNKINHEVNIGLNGKITDMVTLTRKHEGDPDDIFEKQNNVDYVRFYVPAGSRLISANGFDVINSNLFKTPDSDDISKDKDLADIEKNPMIDENSNTRITEEFNKTVFGNWLMVKPGEEKTVILTYELPFKFSIEKKDNFWQKITAVFNRENKNSETENYSLIIQKQPGVMETEFTSRISLLPGSQVENMNGKNNLENNNGAIIYQDDLKTDGYYEIEVK